MNRSVSKRLERIARQVDALPIDPAVVQAAYTLFFETGELPEHKCVALAVVNRALREVSTLEPLSDEEFKEFKAQLRKAGPIRLEMPVPRLRIRLFNEAIHAIEPIRRAARDLLRWLVAAGWSVTDDSIFGIDHDDLPEYGSVTLHLLGFDWRLGVAPYEEQAERLFDRLDDLRARADTNNPAWFDPIEAAIDAFHDEGVLPEDETLLQWVLANCELAALMANYVGEGNPELLMVLDQAAQPDSDAREQALSRLLELRNPP